MTTASNINFHMTAMYIDEKGARLLMSVTDIRKLTEYTTWILGKHLWQTMQNSTV